MSRPFNQPVRNRILASLTALTFTALLAGCSNDDDAPELNESSEVADAATTEYIPASADGPAQNVPEPNLPAAATENTEEGAEATLKYFWEAIDYARLTGETDPISLVSHPTCEFCDVYMDGWHARYEDGDWVVVNESIEIDINDVSTPFDEEAQEVWTEISFKVTQPAADLYVNQEKVVDESVEGDSDFWVADLSYDGTAQRWLVEWVGDDDDITTN